MTRQKWCIVQLTGWENKKEATSRENGEVYDSSAPTAPETTLTRLEGVDDAPITIDDTTSSEVSQDVRNESSSEEEKILLECPAKNGVLFNNIQTSLN